MIKKMLIFLTIFMLLAGSTTPALAQKPLESNGRGNVVKDNRGNGNIAKGSGSHQLAVSPEAIKTNNTSDSGSQLTATTSNDGQGFDQWGYNRTARIFNGTAMEWCIGKVGDETYCESYLRNTVNDYLSMKWNAEWDRGNAEGWINPPYNAWENNEWNGKVPGGSGDVWHYKIVWIGDCGADGTSLENGGYCILGQFEVLMDQGTSDNVHTWFAHAIPNGYGSYP